jgi:magnesium transporter
MGHFGVVRHPSGVLEEGLETQQMAEALGDEGMVGWLDLEAPSPGDLQTLERLFDFHPLAIEDAENPETRPKIEEYDNFLFVVTRGINHNPDASALDLIPLYAFLNRHVIVTVHSRPMRSVATAIERLRRHPQLLQSGPDRLLHHLLDYVIDYYFPVIDAVEDRIEELGDEVFAARKELIAIRRSLGPLREVVTTLMSGVPYVDDDLRPFFRDVYDHVLRLLDELETNRDVVGGLLESYLSQAANRMNAVMKRLTALAMIGLPFTMVSGYFGMKLRGDAVAEAAVGHHGGDSPHVRALGRSALLLQAERLAVSEGRGQRRRRAGRCGAAGAALALAAVLPWGAPRPASALVGDLTPDGIREAITAGIAAITQDDFAEEWQLRLPGGEDIVVSTPFSRLALTARQVAMKGETLTEKQQKDQIDRGKGRIQLLVTMHGGPSRTFARFYTPVLQVDGREIKASFVQNERTPIPEEDGRLAARNVYVFPLEGLPKGGIVTLVVRDAPPEQKEVLRAKLDLGKFR